MACYRQHDQYTITSQSQTLIPPQPAHTSNTHYRYFIRIHLRLAECPSSIPAAPTTGFSRYSLSASIFFHALGFLRSWGVRPGRRGRRQ